MASEPQSAGATPVAGGATPSQSQPASPAANSNPDPAPAMGDPEGLGDPGKRALAAERERAERAERESREAKAELDKLRRSQMSDHEKALAEAKAAGASEVSARFETAIRRSEVRAALLTAGVSSGLVDLAARADQFAGLKVTPEGSVEGLSEAIEAFRKSTPDVFAPKTTTTRPNGDAGLGPRGTSPAAGADMNTIIRRAAGRA